MGIAFQYLHGHGKHLSELFLRHLYRTQPHDAKTPFMGWNATGMEHGSEMAGPSKRSHEFIATHHTLHAS